MKTVDFKKTVQVFSCCDSLISEDQDIIIRRQRFLGRGAQGEVCAVSVDKNDGKNEKEYLADKNCQIIENITIAKNAMRSYMSEYYIAHDLSHPNIL